MEHYEIQCKQKRKKRHFFKTKQKKRYKAPLNKCYQNNKKKNLDKNYNKRKSKD